METIIDISIFSAIGLLGILFYTLFKARKYAMDSTFSFPVFYHENIKPWLWAILMVSVIAVIISYLPATAEAIKNFTGLDIAAEKASFFTLGYGLSALARNTLKTK